MTWRKLLVAAGTALAMASPAAAQRGGSVELGGFGMYPQLDQSLQWENKFGYGGLLGIYFANNLALEADVSRISTKTETGTLDVSVTAMRARLVYNIPVGGRARLMLGAGYSRTRAGKDFDANQSGGTAIAGFKIPLGGHLIWRIEGTMDYLTSPLNGDVTVNKNINYGLRSGLSLLFGGYGPSDSDKDGITNELDLCPDTPEGEQVDSNGCPDTDRDGVRDNMDRCAATPAGTRVDATGCPIKDTDKDGVLDDVDRCADTPAGTAVDANGCPRDSDGDGVNDSADRCANTPAGVNVDATGCPIDADGDGVTDAADRCPNTPRGEQVDGTGCTIRDSDGDGVNDSADKCPDTPAGMLVGADGCLILFVEGKRNVVLEGVTFVVNRAELTIDAKKILDLVAQSLNAIPEVTVEVQGHASSDGSDAANMRLSERRAASVRTYLISKGVAANRLTSKGYGETVPVADNATEEGRKMNRRVELVRTDGGQ